MQEIRNKNFDEERALYGSKDLLLCGCTFSGKADGESALKECGNIEARNCRFDLRYPFWHDTGLKVEASTLAETCRAPLWYSRNVDFKNTIINGVKAFRECDSISLTNCCINSPEFGWNCRGVKINGGVFTTEYCLFGASDVEISDLDFGGKYSFQYTKNITIRSSRLYTKDAFWHSENVTVYDSVISGEYTAWYSKNLHLIRCRIIGTQPFCYAENLYIEDCTMEQCDRAFENSTVNAKVNGKIDSVKNPWHGKITANGYGKVILDEFRRDDSDCEIITNK